MPKTIGPGWTDERIETLKAMYADGKSGGEIAKALEITRNAVIGKLDRLGLFRNAEINMANRSRSGALSAASPLRGPRVTPVRLPRPATIKPTNVERISTRAPLAKPKEAAFDIATAPHARPWIERAALQCQWPLDGPDGETWSCCAPTDTTYCADHRAIATVAFKPWKPKARLAA